ncbi:MAG TPA: hypothetical protein PKX05_03845 [bacterium]|nr:hypothetical protein [bacterium]
MVLAVFLCPCYLNAQPEKVAIQLVDITNHLNPVINIINMQIDRLWHAGKYENIFPFFYLITRLDPHDEEAWSTGGWFLINCIASTKPDSEETIWKTRGIEFLKEGLAHNPDTYRLYWELGWTYYQWNMLDVAIEYIDKAIMYQHPAYVENTRAHILEKLGRMDEAINQWKQIKEKFPEMRFVAEGFIDYLEKQKTNVEQNR